MPLTPCFSQTWPSRELWAWPLLDRMVMKSVRVGEGVGEQLPDFLQASSREGWGEEGRLNDIVQSCLLDSQNEDCDPEKPNHDRFSQSVTMEIRQAPTPSLNTWCLTGHLRHCSCNHIFMKMDLNFKKWYCRLGSENCTPLILRALGS